MITYITTHYLEECAFGSLELDALTIEVSATYKGYSRPATFGAPAEGGFDLHDAYGELVHTTSTTLNGQPVRTVLATFDLKQLQLMIPDRVWGAWEQEAMENAFEDAPDPDDLREQRLEARAERQYDD